MQLSSQLSNADVFTDGPRITRSQRSAEAFREVSSLAPSPPRGIDARSLAAKPPQSFTIRRVDEGSAPRGGAFVGRGHGGFQRPGGAGRGGAGFRGRGGTGLRGTSGRGRGAAGSLGRGGRGKKGSKGSVRQKQQQEESTEFPMSEEEIEYADTGHQLLWAKEYIPQTSMEDLAGWGPPVMAGPRGIVESMMYKVEVATENITPASRHAGVHLAKMNRGNGVTLFENAEARAVTQAFKDQTRRKVAEKTGKVFVPEEIGRLSKAAQTAVLKSWIGGHYIGPKSMEQKDVLGQVEAIAKRNETYLPEDSRKLQDKVRSLLPASALKPAVGRAKVNAPL
jgi:hypothetical protein